MGDREQTGPEEIRRKRLLFRSWHRGTRETDLLVGSFAERHLPGMNPRQLAEYERLLEESDADLFDWMTGKLPPPTDLDTDVMRMMQAFRFVGRPS